MSKDKLPKQTRPRYNQLVGLLSITKASLISLVKNPTTVVFSVLFPLIFILVFGLIGSNGSQISVAVDPNINKDNPVYQALTKIDSIKLITDKSADQNEIDLEKGSIDGILNIRQQLVSIPCGSISPCKDNYATGYSIDLKTSAASPQNGALITSIIGGISDKVNLASFQKQNANRESLIQLNTSQVEGRKYKQIDFILPGQLGFSLLNIGVFGTAFVLLSLRETLVLKRFFATPIARRNILLGEGVARLLFAMMQASIIIGIGTIFLGFTLINGYQTLLQMLGLASIGLIIFLGFGFIVSSIAKSVNTIPPLANLITLPQFLLSGTFFPIEAFPTWLQPISRALPLTYLNDAMRQVAFQGAGFEAIKWDLLYLGIWLVIVYIVAVRTFKWE